MAEAIPLDDASVHAATVGQAFHWFDGDRALTEIHRVGRAGGRGWQSSITAAARASDSGSARGDPSPTRRSNARPPQRRWREAFARSRLWTAVEEVELPHVQLLDREGIVARVAPTSFIAALPATAVRTSSIKSEHLSKDAEPIELPPSASSSCGSTFPSPAMKRQPNSDLTTGRSAHRWLFQ